MSDDDVPFEAQFAEAQQLLKDQFAGVCWRETKEPTPITPDDEVYVSLASFHDNRVTCLASRLVEVVFSADAGAVTEDGTFVGPDRAVVRVVPVNTKARTLCDGANIHGLAEPFFEHEAEGLMLWLDHSITELSLHYSAQGIAHEYLPEIPGDWMFLCVSGNFDPEALPGIFATYLFSLEASHGFAFVLESFPELSEEEYLELMPHDEDIRGMGELPLKPLLSPQLKDILDLYLEAAALPSAMFQILAFTRVVEYVSILVEKTLERETAKVVAEIPDASMRGRLAELINKRAREPGDDALLAQAIGLVCDPLPLAKLAPKAVGELRAVTPENVTEKRDRALKQLSRVASATRNEAAHAKANYRRTGNECPPGQYVQFAALMRVVAQQAIQWLSAQPRESWSLSVPAGPTAGSKNVEPRLDNEAKQTTRR